MANRANFVPGEFYHLYNRGTEKRKVFLNKEDYARFTALLYLCNTPKALHVQELIPRGSTSSKLLQQLEAFKRDETLVDIVAYCLMPNHFHLLVREKETGGISRFMQKLTTAYTMYFNTRMDRSGALFQGKFKSTHADNDTYLAYLISYIHLNPLKLIEPKWIETGILNRKRAEKYLEDYLYSSYLDFCKKDRLEKILLKQDALPEYFESYLDFKTQVTDWLDYRKNLI
jgi:putative transposase